jgi:pimeloyl-ACP methyl ester carboxylesterase
MGEAYDGGWEPKMGALPVDGMRMAYLLWGDDTPPEATLRDRPCKAKQDVVLIHGLTSTARTWWRLAPALARAGYRVVAPDLPGHGDSTAPANDYVLRHTVEAVDALLAALDVRAPIMAGHSWGGALTLIHATEPDMRIRPGRVILLDPLLYLAPGAEGYARELAKMCGAPRAELALTLRDTYPRWHDGDVFWKAEALEKARPAAPLGLTEQNAGADLVPRLGTLRGPWSIIAADPKRGGLLWDEIRAGVDAAVRTNGGRLEIIPGAGHDVYRDDFDATLRLMRLV